MPSTAATHGRHHHWSLTGSGSNWRKNSALRIATGCCDIVDVVEPHQEAWRLPVGDYQLETTSWRLPVGDYQLETTSWRLPVGDYQLETTSWRLPVRQHSNMTCQQFALACHLPQHPCYQLCHRTPDDRQIDDNLYSVGLDLTYSNISPMSQSTTPATSRPSAASTKMKSELSLKAAHQNCSMAERGPLTQANRHCQ